jgi:hypothetical protein
MIVHLENTVKMQDAGLEERVKTIANLQYQILELQEQAPPAPEDPNKADASSGVNED